MFASDYEAFGIKFEFFVDEMQIECWLKELLIEGDM